jgi:hypothetical protein
MLDIGDPGDQHTLARRGRHRQILRTMPDRPLPDASRWTPWLLRAAWVGVGVFGSTAVTAAVDGRSDPVRTVALVLAGLGWLAGVAAVAVPATVTLTAARVVVPLTIPVLVATAVGGAGAADLVGLVVSTVCALAVVASGELGRAFVQASAYGDEQRFPLRPPLGVAAAAVVSWIVWATALTIGPLALAAGAWVPGVLLTALAVAGTVLLPPRWHRLSRRWLVLVPAGMVLHDPVVLADTLMLKRSQVAGVRLAPADTVAADLTGPATGHAIEVSVRESVTAIFAGTRDRPEGRAIHLTAFLASPTRPGAALRAVDARRLPVG